MEIVFEVLKWVAIILAIPLVILLVTVFFLARTKRKKVKQTSNGNGGSSWMSHAGAVAAKARKVGSGLGPFFSFVFKGLVVVGLVILLVAGLPVATGYLERWTALPQSSYPFRPPPTTYGGRLPWEIVAPVISGAESGEGCRPGTGKQFDSNGRVVTNVNTDGTRDYGKYQINSVHEEEWLRRNIDIMTEPGNEEFAIILFDRNYLNDWRSSQDCWFPILAALGLGTLPTADTTYTATLRQGQPAEGIMPRDWKMDWWGDESKFNSHVIWRGENKVRIFTVKAGVDETEITIRIYPCSPEAPCAT